MGSGVSVVVWPVALLRLKAGPSEHAQHTGTQQARRKGSNWGRGRQGTGRWFPPRTDSTRGCTAAAACCCCCCILAGRPASRCAGAGAGQAGPAQRSGSGHARARAHAGAAAAAALAAEGARGAARRSRPARVTSEYMSSRESASRPSARYLAKCDWNFSGSSSAISSMYSATWPPKMYFFMISASYSLLEAS